MSWLSMRSSSARVLVRCVPVAIRIVTSSGLMPGISSKSARSIALRGCAKRVGLTQEQVDDIGSYQTSSRFNDDDKLILRYAEELTLNARVDDDLFTKVEKIVGKGNIIELTGAIAFWNMMARNLNALGVGLES